MVVRCMIGGRLGTLAAHRPCTITCMSSTTPDCHRVGPQSSLTTAGRLRMVASPQLRSAFSPVTELLALLVTRRLRYSQLLIY